MRVTCKHCGTGINHYELSRTCSACGKPRLADVIPMKTDGLELIMMFTGDMCCLDRAVEGLLYHGKQVFLDTAGELYLVSSR